MKGKNPLAFENIEFLIEFLIGFRTMKPAVIRRFLPDWGTTYGPAEDGSFPSIMLLHGSEGGMSGWSHRTAAIFAANGFVCYPHSYSKGGNFWNAGHIEDVEIAETAKALSALREFGPVNGKVAVYGVSRGAEHALMLASLMAEDQMDGLPDAIACLAAPDVICGAFDARSFRDSGDPGGRLGTHPNVLGHGMESLTRCYPRCQPKSSAT